MPTPSKKAVLVSLFFLLCGAFPAMTDAKNRLANQTSPYLLQHADNPVDWFPWSDEALEKAREEQKIIFLSIGYAACHWCHVMEEESFENPKVADALKERFVAIKVDREERPDLDAHFMDMVTAATGQGGWPMTVFLTPDLKFLFGGTYFPVDAKYGRPGFLQILEALGKAWADDQERLMTQADTLNQSLAERLSTPELGKAANGADFRALADTFWRLRFDGENGGFGDQPKFPQPPILSFLLRRAVQSGNPETLRHMELTLDKMAAGGVRDQLGGAFHRYSVDAEWMVPHFEIMLYDNALLARTYLEAFQALGHARYAHVARAILDDMLNRFALPDGGFASSLDADSAGADGEKEEGLYYTWLEEEVKAVLGEMEAGPFLEAYFDPFDGLVEGRSTLRLLSDPTQIVATEKSAAPLREKLLAARVKRPPPPLDDKVLTSWNALLASAFAQAGALLEEPRYLTAADALADHLLEKPWKSGVLRHSRRGKQVGDAVFLDDYVFLAQALLDLHDATFDRRRLTQSQDLMKIVMARFLPAKGKPFQLTPVDAPSPLPPRTELEDGVVPAGNSVALSNLQRLGLITGEKAFIRQAEAMTEVLGAPLERMAPAATELLRAWDFLNGEGREIVLAGESGEPGLEQLLAVVRQRLLPGTVVGLVDGGDVDHPKGWPLFAPRPKQEGRPTAYVCRNFRCNEPVTAPEALADQLDAAP